MHGDVLQRATGLTAMDRNLIRLLAIDGRTPFAVLARSLGEPEKKIRSRVNELVDQGAIRITTVASPKVLGYSVIAMIGVTCRGRLPSAVAKDLAALESFNYVITTTGRFDLLVEVFCQRLTHLREVTERHIRTLDGVWDVEEMPYLKLHYQQAILAGAEPRTPEEAVPEPEETEPMDARIISELSNDGRLPLATVGARIGASEAQVRRRLKRLRDTDSVRVRAITNPMSLGFEMLAMLGVTMVPGTVVAELADVLARIPHVSYVALTAGRYAMLIEVICLDMDELQTLLAEVIRLIPGVQDVEPFIYLDLDYKRVLPASQIAAHPARETV